MSEDSGPGRNGEPDRVGDPQSSGGSDSDGGSDPSDQQGGAPEQSGQQGPRERSVDGATADDEEQWRYAVEDVGEDADPIREPIEPGSPTAENALFVLLGVMVAVVILLATFGVIP